MRILVTTAHPQAVAHSDPHFGRLLVPGHYPRARDTAAAGIPWAADNGCYRGLDVRRYRAMLRALAGLPGCLFVVVPDVVADAAATLMRWHAWRGEVAEAGQPLAYVAQDGATIATVPWHEMDALFVGGSTDWKESIEAALLVTEAKLRGLHVHMGRVNGQRRFNLARLLCCDTVDGSSFSRFRSTWLPRATTEWVAAPLRAHQHRLPEAIA